MTKMERGILFGEGENPSPPVPDITYPIDGHSTIVVPGPVRESCHEVLFERDNDQLSLPNIILDAIEKVPYYYHLKGYQVMIHHK